MGAIIGIIYFAIVVFLIVTVWIVYTKAGKPGWACIIPIYRTIVMLEIVGKPWWWWFLILILPFVFGIWMINLLSKSFGHGVGFTLGLIFLPFIFYPILAFGGSQYKGPAGQQS